MYLDTASISHLSLGIISFILYCTVQCFIDFIVASPTVTSHFRHILVLGLLYNAILLLRAHAQSCASRIQSRHTRTHGHVASSHSIMLIDNCASACISLGRYRWYLDTYPWPCSSFYNPVLYCNHQRLRVSISGHRGGKALWPRPSTTLLLLTSHAQ